MKKTLLALTLSLFFGATLMAQGVNETEASIGDKRMPAYSVTLNKSDKIVEEALNQRFKEAGMRGKKISGYWGCLNTVFTEIAATPVDFYAKVEGNKNESVVTVCAVSSDYKTDQSLINAAVRHFVEGFGRYVERYEAGALIEAKEKELKSAQKVQADAASTLAKLEKNAQKYQKDLEAAQKKMEKYAAKVAKCEKDIAKIQKNMEGTSGEDLKSAQDAAAAADKKVQELQAEIDSYRAALQ